MARYVWNKVEKCVVPYNPRLRVEKDLEWRGTDDEVKPVEAPQVQPISMGEALALLDPDNEDHFTKAGKPNAKVLSEIMGREIKAVERDALWEDYQKGQEI